MGGHGGLNILPQKRWNVYNFDNREKVRKDEEAAAKEEQLKREQSRKRDFELRLVQLRQARGLAPSAQASSPSSETKSKSKSKSESKSKSPELESKSKLNHINLFEGIKFFDPVVFGGEGKGEDEGGAFKKMKMAKKEAAPRVVMPEDEKYRLGYGIAGKGVKLPWYLSKPNDDANVEEEDDHHHHRSREGAKSGVKKTLEQLREERLKREKKEKEREQALMLEKRFNRDKKEKERERALILEKGRRDVPFLKDRGFSRREWEVNWSQAWADYVQGKT
ncbi:unnamed protein product [Camellia sinensis]